MLRSRDLCLALTVGPWGGFHMRWWKGIRIWSLNLGFIGIRAWRGDLPSVIVNEVQNLAKASGGKLDG